MAGGSRIVERLRVATPRGDCQALLRTVADIVTELERRVQHGGLPVGVSHPARPCRPPAC